MDQRIALGQIIGDRYKLIEKLGQGTFGTTFIAKDTNLPSHSRCVVKQLTPKGNINSEIIKRFEREAKILEELGNEHPQIPRLLAYFQENKEFYLVQELIEGDTLVKEFANLPFSEEQVKRLVRDILEILIFVQEKNCIHRDIKPSNLMRRTSDNKIVLIDFGAVKEKINSQITDSQEQPSVMAGTIGYMPDEQIRGYPCFQSDIYAVGMLAIYGLTGKSPISLTDRDGKVNWRNYLANDREYDRNFLDFLDNLVRFNRRDRYSSAALANRPADRVIYSYRDGEQKLKRMQAWNLKNNRAYVVTYTAEEDKFDRFLNNAEKIIDSLKID